MSGDNNDMTVTELVEELENRVEDKDEKIERLERNERVEKSRREDYQENFAWEKFDNLVNISEYVDRDEVEFKTQSTRVEIHITSPQTTLKLIVNDQVTGDRTFEARIDAISVSMWDDNVDKWNGYEKALEILGNGGDLICSHVDYLFETFDGDLFKIDFDEGEVSEDVEVSSNWFMRFEYSDGRIDDEVGDLVAIEKDHNSLYYVFERYTIQVESSSIGGVRQNWVRVSAENVLMESDRDVLEVDESYSQQAVAAAI